MTDSIAIAAITALASVLSAGLGALGAWWQRRRQLRFYDRRRAYRPREKGERRKDLM